MRISDWSSDVCSSDLVEIVPTDGHPGVFGTIDVGAPRTLGIYFMYDVKQFDASEWSSPPLEGKMVERLGFGQAIMGRVAVNQKGPEASRSEEHTSELQSLMRVSYAVFCLKQKKITQDL